VLPSQIQKAVIEQKIASPIGNGIIEPSEMHDLATSIMENLTSWMDGRVSVQMDDKALALLEKLSKGNSSLSDLCSIFSIVKKMDSKLLAHADEIIKRGMEQNRKGESADIDKISAELSASLDISSEQKELLAMLNKYNDTFLYHLLYPAVYIGTYVESGKWQEAKKLLAEYQNKYQNGEKVINAIQKEIEEFENKGKKPYYLEDKFIAMEFDDIINDQKLDIKAKGEIFEEKILKLSGENKLTPTIISNIIKKAFILAVSRGKYKKPLIGVMYCFYDILPAEKPFEQFINYEKGLVQFYEDEPNFKAEYLKKYPYAEEFYDQNLIMPIYVYVGELEVQPKAGKVLYDFLNETKKEKNSIYSKLKEECNDFSEVRSLINTLETRYGKF
jgi:hypothetical protein